MSGNERTPPAAKPREPNEPSTAKPSLQNEGKDFGEDPDNQINASSNTSESFSLWRWCPGGRGRYACICYIQELCPYRRDA